jgi:hypothetical protein
MTDTSASQDSLETPANENAMEEWKMARSVFTTFDGYINDLRKLGFAVLAALFTVDALQKFTAGSTVTTIDTVNAGSNASHVVNTAITAPMDETTKLGLIGVTIFYIVILRFLEHDYQQYLNATSVRAIVLERILNIELSETIAGRYRRQKLDMWNFGLYCLFIGIAVCIAAMIIPWGFHLGMAIIFGVIGFFSLVVIQFLPGLSVKLHHDTSHYTSKFSEMYQKIFLENICHDYVPETKWIFKTDPKKLLPLPSEDWIIDKVSCIEGEKVRITVTNLDEFKPIYFASILGDPVEIWKDGGNEKIEDADITPVLKKDDDHSQPKKPVAPGQPAKEDDSLKPDLKIMGYDNFSWIWDTTNCDAGTIYRAKPRGWSRPLGRSVQVLKRPAKPQENKGTVNITLVHEDKTIRLV